MGIDRLIFSAACYISWCELGVKDLKLNNMNMSFTVPKSSEHIDVHGNEMCGKLLARRMFKKCAEIGINFNSFIYEIRDEEWTKEKAKQAREEAIKTVKYML